MENNPKPTLEIKPETQLPPQKGTTQSQVSKHSSKTLWYIGSGIAVLLLIGGLLVVLQKSKTKSLPTQQPVVQQPTLSPKPTLARSKAPGIIVSIVTAKGIDPKTGEAIKPTAIFLTTDKNIYAVTTLQNVKVGTRIEYVRYLNNKFLDNRSIKITKPNTNNTSFVWTLKKLGATHLPGTYKVKVYTNGIFEKETSYTIQ